MAKKGAKKAAAEAPAPKKATEILRRAKKQLAKRLVHKRCHVFVFLGFCDSMTCGKFSQIESVCVTSEMSNECAASCRVIFHNPENRMLEKCAGVTMQDL